MTKLDLTFMLRNFVVTMITPVAINSIGYKYYIVYTLIGFCVPFSVYFLYPEVSHSSPETVTFRHDANHTFRLWV